MVHYISLIGCKLPPLDGYMAVLLVLTKEVYIEALAKTLMKVMSSIEHNICVAYLHFKCLIILKISDA